MCMYRIYYLPWPCISCTKIHTMHLLMLYQKYINIVTGGCLSSNLADLWPIPFYNRKHNFKIRKPTGVTVRAERHLVNCMFSGPVGRWVNEGSPWSNCADLTQISNFKIVRELSCLQTPIYLLVFCPQRGEGDLRSPTFEFVWTMTDTYL